ncbi:NAD-dependent deacylase [Salinisphaera sp. P385]|uniref:NAD-dependent protein deacylase n=1 Tax=Spectribacter acetivorans TaxID=3075603 RepID=A0ABU3B3F3_9GAMM|nr:NAD-dependent deacylase [Salinisphaera sp. P385]MDT0616992.1 NAD-dependent deacylase [Salinisphaera sp. P385]
MTAFAADWPPALVAEIAAADTVAVLTGAGVSAASGIPTFREAQTGLWAQFRPEELATPEAFAADPGRVWQWYQWRRSLIARAEPNGAHRAIARLQRHLADCRVITQNVDGLHERAGARVAALHGNIWRQRCHRRCGHQETVAAPDEHPQPPVCPACGGPVRPDVVWFGETLPGEALDAAVAAVERADVVLVAGTSGLVYPAAALPEQALALGRTVVEINPDDTPLSTAVTARSRAAADVALATLCDALDLPD